MSLLMNFANYPPPKITCIVYVEEIEVEEEEANILPRAPFFLFATTAGEAIAAKVQHTFVHTY